MAYAMHAHAQAEYLGGRRFVDLSCTLPAKAYDLIDGLIIFCHHATSTGEGHSAPARKLWCLVVPSGYDCNRGLTSGTKYTRGPRQTTENVFKKSV